jgi:hypothetical protein
MSERGVTWASLSLSLSLLSLSLSLSLSPPPSPSLSLSLSLCVSAGPVAPSPRFRPAAADAPHVSGGVLQPFYMGVENRMYPAEAAAILHHCTPLYAGIRRRFSSPGSGRVRGALGRLEPHSALPGRGDQPFPAPRYPAARHPCTMAARVQWRVAWLPRRATRHAWQLRCIKGSKRPCAAAC